MKTKLALIAICHLLSTIWFSAFAQGTAFTYQGRFTDNGVPFTGSAEFQATLWDAASNGTVLASNSPVSIPVGVTNGLFVLPLNFGANFPGADRWLQLEVRTTLGPFTPLTPRQQLKPTPYAITAITASNLSGTLPVGQLSGTVSDAQLSANVSLLGASIESAEIADGTIVAADVNAASFNNTFWRASGNASTTPGTHFLGTTDNQPLEFKVNSVRTLRLEPNTNGAPNVIGGSPRNFVADGVVGATIGGGGATNYFGFSFTNRVTANFGTVPGGRGNTAGENATAMGSLTSASGLSSTAMGESTTASGNNSTAMGFHTTANGQTATAMGRFTTASGHISTAMGNQAQANHNGAFVWADSALADFASTAPNQFSIRAANGLRIYNPGQNATLLTLETERPWAFRQLNTGANTSLELGTVDPANPKPFIIQANAVGIGTAAPTHLLHVNGVARSAQSTWATSSDRRAKRDIATLKDSLERIARLRPVSFEYTPEYAAGRAGYKGRFTGFIAQEVEPVFPEMVETVHEKIGDQEVQDFRVLNTGGLTPHLVAAIQDLNGELEQKETEITELKRAVSDLKELVQAMNQKLNGGTK